MSMATTVRHVPRRCCRRRVLSQKVRRGATMSSPQAVKDDLPLEIGTLEHEVFRVLFVDGQHRAEGGAGAA